MGISVQNLKDKALRRDLFFPRVVTSYSRRALFAFVDRRMEEFGSGNGTAEETLRISIIEGVLLLTVGATFIIHAPSSWVYGNEPCAQFLSNYLDFYYNSGIMLTVTILDIIVVVRLRSMKQVQGGVPRNGANGGQRVAAIWNTKELMFFLQSIACSGALLILTIVYYTLIPLTTTMFSYSYAPL
ncbi:hypothetical protein COOONC_00768 [Cooperia oncophora]